jgi:neutral ceramidase
MQLNSDSVIGGFPFVLRLLSLPLLIAILAAIPSFAASFRAGVAKVDISPQTSQWLMGYGPRKSSGVHDPIYHRAVVMDDGRSRFYLVASDLCLFSPELYDEVAADLKQKLAIEPKQFWWSVTHTHSAPEVGPHGVYDVLLKGRSDHEWDRDYAQHIKSTLIAAVEQASGKLEPARLQTGTGTSNANINRRAKDVDGKISLGLNPDGAVDRQIGLIRMERPDGAPIALIVNYAIHGTVLSGRSEVISGDAPGIVSAYVEQKLGAPVLFVNGAAGNAAPIYSVYPDPKSGHLGEFRVLLGDRILQANARMPAGSADVSIRAEETFVETPLRSGLQWPEVLRSYSRVDSNGKTFVHLPVRFLTIKGTALWAAPVELFSEIAMDIRNKSPFTNTFYFGYTNGWFGYLPTATAFAEGGYEPATSVLTDSAEADLTKHVVENFKRLQR